MEHDIDKRLTRFTCGPLEYRINRMQFKGQVWPGHKHNFGHVTQVMQGPLHVDVRFDDGRPGIDKIVQTGDVLMIEAEGFHTITALADNCEFWCVFPHRTEDGVIVPNRTGFEGAYC